MTRCAGCHWCERRIPGRQRLCRRPIRSITDGGASGLESSVCRNRGRRRYPRNNFQNLIAARAAREWIVKRVSCSSAGYRPAEIGPWAAGISRPLRLVGLIGGRGPAQQNAGFDVGLDLSTDHTRADDDQKGGRRQIDGERSLQPSLHRIYSSVCYQNNHQMRAFQSEGGKRKSPNQR